MCVCCVCVCVCVCVWFLRAVHALQSLDLQMDTVPQVCVHARECVCIVMRLGLQFPPPPPPPPPTQTGQE